MKPLRLIAIWISVGIFGISAVHAAPCPTPDGCDPALLERRSLDALRLSGAPPVIDGRLDEPVWSQAPVATGFIQSKPNPGAAAALRSEARVLVDEEAIYVGLTYFDPEPEKILTPLARRDDETVSDWAFVEIDSRHDRRSGFSFGVNPRGVQVDGLWTNDTQYDSSWNAVWEAAAHVDARGWTAEFRIPFSQIAFSLPAGPEGMVWGINFYRNSPAHGETSNWSPRYSSVSSVVSRFNDLHLPAPARVHRLEATPYTASRMGNDGPAGDRKSSTQAGADLKVGLGSNFSLTATLLPDFGQVEADPSQVNLTAFELFQAEQRPFFLEGIDVFRMSTSLAFATRETSFADESPFYSRRVGRAPRGDLPAGVTVAEIAAATQLLGALKLSGQTAGGWTLGVFAAESERERALLVRPDGLRLAWPVEARSTATVARALRGYGHDGSFFGFLAADLHRSGLEPVLASQEVSDAAAVGAEIQHRFGEGRYEVRSWALESRLTGDEEAIARVAESPSHYFQRPDALELPRAPYGTRLDGLAAETRLSRVEGSLLWNLTARAVSPGFDVDELGFQRNSDWLLLAGDWIWQSFRPGHRIRAWALGSSNLGSGWTWAGDPRTRVLDAWASLDTGNYWHARLAATREMSTLSTAWLRGGPALLLPPRTTLALSVATDQRKASYGTLDVSAGEEPASGSRSLRVSPLVNLRLSDKLQTSVGTTWESDTVGWQPVGHDGTEYRVARLRQQTLSFTFRADLTLNPRLALQAYLQPFSSVGSYDGYQRLATPRDRDPGRRFVPLEPGAPVSPPDAAQRSLNGDLVLRWEYHPGSFLTVVWNHQRSTLSLDARATAENGLTRLFGDPPVNVLLVKVSRRFGG